jgi:hypothetical protein
VSLISQKILLNLIFLAYKPPEIPTKFKLEKHRKNILKKMRAGKSK